MNECVFGQKKKAAVKMSQFEDCGFANYVTVQRILGPLLSLDRYIACFYSFKVSMLADLWFAFVVKGSKL